MNRTYQLNTMSLLLFTLYYLKSHLALRKVYGQVLEIRETVNS